MSKQQHIDTIREMVKDVKYAMVTTITSEGHLHACPMTTLETSLGAKEIWFIGDKSTEMVGNLKERPQVNIAYSCQPDKEYVSINGKAELVDDQAKLDELWSPLYNAFYEHGKEDPNVQLIKVVPHGAEYWRSGNAILGAVKLAAAALQDGKTAENMGEHYSITF